MASGSKRGGVAVREGGVEMVPLVNSVNSVNEPPDEMPDISKLDIADVREDGIDPVNSISPRPNTKSQPHTARLTSLPEELLDRIVSSLDKPALTHITHTCKLLSRIALPHLWSTLHLVLSFKTLPKPKRLALIQYLTATPHLAAYIQTLHIHCKDTRIYPEFWIPWFINLATTLPNLTSFLFTDDFIKRPTPDYPLQKLLAPLHKLATGTLNRLSLDYSDTPLTSEPSLFLLPISHLHIHRATYPLDPHLTPPPPPPPAPFPLPPHSPITHLSIADFPCGANRPLRPLVSGDPPGLYETRGLYDLDWAHDHLCPRLWAFGRIFPALVSFAYLVGREDRLPEFYARNLVRVVEGCLGRGTLRRLVLGGRATAVGYAPVKWGVDDKGEGMRMLRCGSEIEELDIYAGSLLEAEGPEEWRFDLELPRTLRRLTLRKVECVYDKVMDELRALSKQGVRKRFPLLERLTMCGAWGDVLVGPEGQKKFGLPYRKGYDGKLMFEDALGETVKRWREESEVVESFAGLREEYAEQGVRLDFVREKWHKEGLPPNERDDAIMAVLQGRSGGSDIPGLQ